MLHEIRFEFDQQHDEAFSLSAAPTINVSDAFNIGGAGVNSRGTDREFELADNLDFQPSRNHAMRVGILLEGGRYDNFDARNAAGTFTFATRQDYLAGRPLNFTQRLGEVDTSFFHYQLGMYWQDDVRVNSWLSYSLGLRQEMQSHVGDKLNLMPRLGFTLTPNDGKTTIRGGYGLFHDWYSSNLYDQTLRVNGVDQIDLLIINPGYPDPFSGAAGDVLPGGRVQASPDLKMPYVHQASIGIEQPITDNLQLQVSYQMLRGRNQLRSRDINAPDENGIRSNPDIGTITQYESTGRSATDRLTFSANYRVPERRLFMGANYTLGSAKNHADSALQLPTDSLNPDVDWGPSSQDVRHRLNAMINLPLPAEVQMSVRANAQSASPYTITTGRDDNRDGVTNDRPEGTGRNTERGEARWDLSLRVSKSLGFGGPRSGGGGGGGFRGGRPGVAQQRGPGGRGGGFFGGRDQRFSVELYAQANNVLNRTNYLNFSGNKLSPFFGKPTSASQARRVELGMQFRF
jgi:hypothetical protein